MRVAVDTLLGLWSVIRHAHTPHRAWLPHSTVKAYPLSADGTVPERTCLSRFRPWARGALHTLSHHRKRSLRERVDQVSVGCLRV